MTVNTWRCPVFGKFHIHSKDFTLWVVTDGQAFLFSIDAMLAVLI